jgi:hypothetical protein
VDVYFVLFHQESNALDQPVGYLPAAFYGHAIIQFEIVEGKAEFLAALPQDMRHFGILEQRLRRDTAHVQAYAAQPLFVDDGGLLPELRRADGGRPGPRRSQ